MKKMDDYNGDYINGYRDAIRDALNTINGITGWDSYDMAQDCKYAIYDAVDDLYKEPDQ